MDVLTKATKLVTPSLEETEKVNKIVRELTTKIASKDASLTLGGSVAKGTWLPGITDIDFFLKFNYAKYNNKSLELPKHAKRLLRGLKAQEIPGSRNYFRIKYKGYICEIIPVLNITSIRQAMNLTDISPLHVNWVARKSRAKITTEIRLTKQFFKGIGVYGAESYIRGFSGHVCEVLTIHYGSFTRLLRAASKWKKDTFIDVSKHYSSKDNALKRMNASKLYGPLNLVDPVQPERNAAAVLSQEKYNLLIKKSQAFLNKPSMAYFREKVISLEDVKKRKGRKLILLAKPESESQDIAGCKILKKYNKIGKALVLAGFKVKNTGWYWDKNSPALLWYVIDSRKLPAIYRHWGPPLLARQDRIADFKRKYRGRTKVLKNQLYIDLPRKIRSVEDFSKLVRKEVKGISIKIF